MARIDELTEAFKFLYEKFQIGCDAIEELDLWDKEKHGEMDVFFLNDIISVILRLITADGNIGKKEVAYLDQCFGLKYSVDDLTEIYMNCREALGDAFLSDYQSGFRQMQSINGKLADAYKDLLHVVFDIIIESDGVIAPEEIAEAKRIKALF